jgi:hypothetical protein
MRSVSSRLKVVGPAFAAGAALSALAACSGATKMAWSFAVALEVWASPLMGPFAGLWATSTWSPVEAFGWSVACGLAIATHPLRPGWLTGFVSTSGVAVWVLFGLVLTHDGV